MLFFNVQSLVMSHFRLLELGKAISLKEVYCLPLIKPWAQINCLESLIEIDQQRYYCLDLSQLSQVAQSLLVIERPLGRAITTVNDRD